MQVRTVLFDLGNVLVRFDPDRFWTALGVTDQAVRTRLKPQMLALGREYESGSIPTAEFRKRFGSLIGPGHTADELHAAFLSVLPHPVPGMEELVSQVAAATDTALVSNTNPIHFDLCLSTVPVLRSVRRFYLSYELRALKPDPMYYRKVMEGEAAMPSELLFIDDLEANVEAARQAGMQGIVFRGAEELEIALRGAGVL